MGNITKAQHYVPQCYLESWNNGKRLWCKDLKKGKVYHTATHNIAQKRFFNQIKRISKSDADLVLNMVPIDFPYSEKIKEFINLYKLIGEMPHFSKEDIKQLLITNFPAIADKIRTTDINEEKLPEIILSFENETKMVLEKIYSEIEGEGKIYLEKIKKGDYQWYNNEERIDFIIFLGMQYTRTDDIRKRLPDEISEEVKPLLTFIMGFVIACSIYNNNYHIKVLKTKGETEFITSSNPAINIKRNKDGKPPREFDLYMPISYNVAIILTKEEDNTIDIQNIENSDVEKYNKLLIDDGPTYIFARDKKYL